MAVILPSLDDIIMSKPEISTTMVLENNEHINIKDIRQLFGLFKKQNIQFLELLFTRYKIINPNYKEYLDELFSIREEVADMNTRVLFLGICGMGSEKFKALKHPYPNTLAKIEKYGYDGKQLHHLVRLKLLADNLLRGMSFENALICFTEQEKDFLIKCKLNEYSLSRAETLAQYYYNSLQHYKEMSKEFDCITNKNTEEKLNKIKQKIMTCYFKNTLIPKKKEPIFDVSNYKNVYLISDLHFGHENILDYEDRKSKMNITTIQEHDEKLIENWNSIVKDKDLVFILGDISFTNALKTNELLSRLKGDKVLIIGNHDYQLLNNKDFNKDLFLEIADYKEICYKKQIICLMHYPIYSFKNMYMKSKPWLHFYGHVHSKYRNKLIHSYNVGVDVNNYKPVRIESAINRALNNHEKQPHLKVTLKDRLKKLLKI